MNDVILSAWDPENCEPAAPRRASAVSHWRAVSALLETRQDLQGVCPLADLVHEAVRWAA